MNNRFSFSLSGFFALMSGIAYSGNTIGTVSVLETHPTANMLYVTINGTNNSPPTCNTSNRYVLDISTGSGRAAYAGLLTAKATNQSVLVYGTGVCTLSAATGSEDFMAMRQ